MHHKENAMETQKNPLNFKMRFVFNSRTQKRAHKNFIDFQNFIFFSLDSPPQYHIIISIIEILFSSISSLWKFHSFNRISIAGQVGIKNSQKCLLSAQHLKLFSSSISPWWQLWWLRTEIGAFKWCERNFIDDDWQL